MNEPSRMHIMEGIRGLFHIRDKLLSKGQPLAPIGLTEEVIDHLWRVFHNEVGLLVLQLPKIINGQNIGVVHAGNTLCLSKKVLLCLLVELIQTQHLQGQNAAQWCGFTHFIDIAIAPCANKRNNLIDTDMGSPHQEITTLTANSTIRVIMSPNRVCIETVGHVWNPTSSLEILYLLYLRLCQLWVTNFVTEMRLILYYTLVWSHCVCLILYA